MATKAKLTSILLFSFFSFISSCSKGVSIINFKFKLIDYSTGLPLPDIIACTIKSDSSRICGTSDYNGILTIEYPAEELHYNYYKKNYYYFESGIYNVNTYGVEIFNYDSTYLLTAFRRKFIKIENKNSDHLSNYSLYATPDDYNKTISISKTNLTHFSGEIDTVHEMIYYWKYPNYTTLEWQELDSLKIQFHGKFANSDSTIYKFIYGSFTMKDTVNFKIEL